jgi:hypothetical protein
MRSINLVSAPSNSWANASRRNFSCSRSLSSTKCARAMVIWPGLAGTIDARSIHATTCSTPGFLQDHPRTTKAPRCLLLIRPQLQRACRHACGVGGNLGAITRDGIQGDAVSVPDKPQYVKFVRCVVFSLCTIAGWLEDHAMFGLLGSLPNIEFWGYSA